VAGDVRGVGRALAAIVAPDRQLDRPHAPARGGRKIGVPDHAIGRSRGGLSTKIHAVVDQDGLPVRLLITAGQASDKTAVPELLDGPSAPQALVADRGYDSDAVLALVTARGAEPHIPSTSRRCIKRSVDPGLYRQRSLAERYFCKLKHFRRIATRFGKLARNFLASVALASTRLLLRHVASRP
jgi:transposase